MDSKKWPKWSRRLLRLARPRSAGVTVPRSVMRLIWKGDDARQLRDWGGAAEAFGQALAKAPHLAHLWVQYGHMLREGGARSKAADAYRRAVALSPDEREPHELLIRLARASGDRAGAFRHALALFRTDPADPRLQTTLLQAVSIGEPGHAEIIVDIAARLNLAAPSVASPEPATLYIDVGDLIAHFAGSRLPSGLQRVEIEVTRSALARTDAVPALCCWSSAAMGWKLLSGPSFLALVEAAASDVGEVDWRRRLNMVLLEMASAPVITFPPDATLFQLGMAWNDALYYPAVVREKERGGLRFAAIACDVIPLVRADEIPADIVAACGEWLDALAQVADSIIAISSATRDELVTVSRARGAPIATDRIEVVPLDATFTTPLRGTTAILPRLGLSAGSYALYVSTVEPRKNHLAALAAWRQLIAGGGAGVPDLVCVGRKGWRSAAVHEALHADGALARHVHMLERVTDDDLDELYKGCAFVFYPSLHEGWGLPVTEALARGKVPVVGRNSSLPEAGGRFAVYVDATSPTDMARVIGALLRDPAGLAAHEARIREGFRPRQWAEIADDMIALATGVSRSSAG